LEPAFTATKLLSGSKYPTQGGLCLIIGWLRKHLERQLDPSVNTQWRVADAMKEKLDTYWPILCDTPSVLAALFDPRTKLSSFELDEQETSIATLEECYKLYMPTGETRIEEKPKSTFTLFKSLMRDNTTGQPRVSNEIESYLALNDENEDMDPLAWWQIHEDRYPTLARAARDYLGIQATSVPCEQTFSVAKNTISLVRNRIDGENARASLCLKSWYLDPDL